ncbi:LysM peptidoglycan-binding domain-containing protein [Leucothrix sargassi]|nr:LysM peptidoglycan-binding domain-containing protein [Leucothrix sargassi]
MISQTGKDVAMKILNTAIVTSLLALGLAGNSMAAPNKAELYLMQQKAAQQQQQQRQAKQQALRVQQQRAAQARQQAAKQKALQAQRQAAQQRAIQAKQKALQARQQAARIQQNKVVNKRVAKTQTSHRNYRVQNGDTLYRIAQRNNIPVQTLVKLNNLWGSKATNLSIGAVIRLN